VNVAVLGHSHFPIATSAIQSGNHVEVVSMQEKPHAKVAKAAKTQAANVVRSPVLHSLFSELFFRAILT
jgi:hypothetical protein